MFVSLRAKIIFFITLIVAITGIVIVFYTRRDVERAMLRAEESSARNVLELVELNIKAGYNTLLFDKFEECFGTVESFQGDGSLSEGYLGLYHSCQCA